MSDETTYTLNVNAQQAALIQRSLEMYSRLKSGQIEMVLHDQFVDRYGSETWNHDSQKKLCGDLKQAIFPELSQGAYYGVGSRVYPEADVAWDIMQVLRHRLAWDRAKRDKKNPIDCWTNQYDNPTAYSGLPLPTIESNDE